MDIYKDEDKKILLVVLDDYFMTIRGNKLKVEKQKEINESIYLYVELQDVILADDFNQCIAFLTKNCFLGKTVYITGFNYPAHIKVLLESGFMIQDQYLVKTIETIKEKERG